MPKGLAARRPRVSLGFGVWGLGFGVLGFGVWGLGPVVWALKSWDRHILVTHILTIVKQNLQSQLRAHGNGWGHMLTFERWHLLFRFGPSTLNPEPEGFRI